MKLSDSFKGFKDSVIGKAISPAATCARALDALRSGSEAILSGYAVVSSPSGIPQYRAYGAPEFRRVAGAEGTNGKGHTHQQALASALMEMVERYSCFRLLRGRKDVLYETSDNLTGRHIKLEELMSLRSRSVQQLDSDLLMRTPVLWYPGMTLGGEPTHLPLALLLHLEGTNGMTAGNSMEEALLHGLCEVVERHCRGFVTEMNLETPRIDTASIKAPLLTDLIRRLQKLTGHELMLRDFSLGIGLPVIAVARQVNEQKCLVTVGVATHPDEALARALTENSQSDNPQHYCRLSEVSGCFADKVEIPYSSLPDISHDNMRIEVETMNGLLSRHGMEAAFADATVPELGIPSAYVFISGSRYYDRDAANRNFLSAAVSQGVFASDWNAVERLLELSTTDRVNAPFYNLCRGALHRANGAYQEASAFYSTAVSATCAKMSDIEANLLRQTALAHLAVCRHAEGRPAESIKALQHLQSRWPDYDFHYLHLQYPPSFAPLMETRENFDTLRQLSRRSPHESQAALTAKLQTLHGRRKELHDKVRRLVNALADGQQDKAMAILETSDDLDHLIFTQAGLCPQIAAAYEHLGRYEQAIRYYLEAESVSPLDPLINAALARCYQHTGELDKLQQQIKRLTGDI